MFCNVMVYKGRSTVASSIRTSRFDFPIAEPQVDVIPLKNHLICPNGASVRQMVLPCILPTANKSTTEIEHLHFYGRTQVAKMMPPIQINRMQR